MGHRGVVDQDPGREAVAGSYDVGSEVGLDGHGPGGLEALDEHAVSELDVRAQDVRGVDGGREDDSQIHVRLSDCSQTPRAAETRRAGPGWAKAGTLALGLTTEAA